MVLAPHIESGAEISDDGQYRYNLWRSWDVGKPDCLFIMLNPSTADAEQDDPTIRRCIDYAKRWGYGGLQVGNLFALRATHPKDLRNHLSPTGGQKNDDVLKEMHNAAHFTVAAWGTQGAYMGQGDHVKSLLRPMKGKIYHLGLTVAGFPRHPLYLRKDAEPTLWINR